MKDYKHRLAIFRIVVLMIFYCCGISKAHTSELPQLSSNSFISLVVCSPSVAYEGTFGHTAIRIQDASLKIDVIFNYGSYNPNQSFFFYKILLGKLESSLEGEAFYQFVERYQAEGRGIKEYYLDLTQPERQLLWETLNNTLFSGHCYKFNVTQNNCSTHVRDILFEKLNLHSEFYKGLCSGYTYRDFEHMEEINNCWLHLLFNLIVGAKSDAKCSVYDACFSPIGLAVLMKVVNENERSLLMAEHELAPIINKKESPCRAVTIIVFSILLLVSIILSYKQYLKGTRYLIFDQILFFVSGVLGLFFLSLMCFSETSVLKINYNILWTLPSNILLAITLRKNKKKRLSAILARIQAICILFFIVSSYAFQYIPIEAYLFALTLFVRLYFYIAVNIKTK